MAFLTRYLPPSFETMLVGGVKDDSEESSEFILKEMGIAPIIIPEMHRKISLKNDWISYNKIKKLIEAFKPDIVHTHAAKAGTIGRLAAHHLNVPIIVHTFHGHVFHSYFGKLQTTVYKNIERYLARKTSTIIAISEKQKEELSIIHQIAPREKIEVVPLGFDLTKFGQGTREKRKLFRDKYWLEEDEIAIGIVGRLVPVKNHRLFLEALQFVQKKSTKKIRAFIIGDGESISSVKNLSREFNLEFSNGEVKSFITFTSWIKEIDIAYAGLDIVALTSFNEGTPVSLIEAQAAGKPVVSTRVGGIEDVVLENQTGLLSNIRDSKKFFMNLVSLIENEDYRIKLGKDGKQIMNEKFNYLRLASDMARVYNKLLES